MPHTAGLPCVAVRRLSEAPKSLAPRDAKGASGERGLCQFCPALAAERTASLDLCAALRAKTRRGSRHWRRSLRLRLRSRSLQILRLTLLGLDLLDLGLLPGDLALGFDDPSFDIGYLV